MTSLSTFTIVQRALDASEDDPDHAGLPHEVRLAGRVQHAVQTVVDCLVDPSGGKYEVSFADISTAATSLGARKIIVSSKPLRDPMLSLVEKAVVIATFAAHEIGHTVVTKPRGTIVRDHNPKSGYHAVANVADDIILEPVMTDAFPILEDAFEFTGLWVLRTTRKVTPTVEDGRWDSTAARFNSLLSATRYGDIADIVFTTDKARDERDWARDWARRLIALRLSDHGGFIALCDEAWVRIRTKDDDEISPPGGDIEDPEPEPTDEDGEDEGGCKIGPGGESEPEDEPEDEDGDGDEDGEDEGGTPGGSTPGGDGDDEPKGDGTDEGGTPGDPNDQPVDWDDEPKGSDKGGDMTGDPTKDGESGEGGGGAKDTDRDDVTAPDLRDEDDFNPREVDQTTHEQAESTGWEDTQNESRVATFNNTVRTAFPTHGDMTTTWD